MNYKFKIVMTGSFCVGKTSLVKRYVYDAFDDSYLTTIGVKVSKKELSLHDDRGSGNATLLLWDIAGSETFNTLPREYYMGASGVIVVADVTRIETIERVEEDVKLLKSINPASECIIAYNKIDLCDKIDPQYENTRDAMRQVSDRTGLKFFETSAKESMNVDEMFSALAKMILDGKK